MFDYNQRPITKEYSDNWPKIFMPGIIGIEQKEECHYSQGGKYICICESNICKKDIKR